jgi:hypothetical protein
VIGRDNLEETGVDDRIIDVLKCILKKWVVKVWREFNKISLGSTGSCYCQGGQRLISEFFKIRDGFILLTITINYFIDLCSVVYKSQPCLWMPDFTLVTTVLFWLPEHTSNTLLLDWYWLQRSAICRPLLGKPFLRSKRIAGIGKRCLTNYNLKYAYTNRISVLAEGLGMFRPGPLLASGRIIPQAMCPL